jgi:D-alanyl-D-alanine carboxypeptidase
MLLRFLIFSLVLAIGAVAPVHAANSGKYAVIVIDAASGRVLESANAELLRHPASLTKVMTLYLTFKALEAGTLHLDQPLSVSRFAAAQSPSKLGLTPERSIRVRDAILGLVTQSANDASVVLAEALGGSEDNFARRMTAQARELGMSRTIYRNASGLPDDEQVTTAKDQALLARAILRHFPNYYRYFKTRSFTYLGRTHDNHNRLMRRYAGMDGIKTGYIRASGFNLMASAVRGDTRLIAVIFGGSSARSRDEEMETILDGVFRRVARGSFPMAAVTPLPTLSVSEAEGDGAETEEVAVKPKPPARKIAPTRPVAKPLTTPARTAGWSVRLGAFSTKDAAERVIKQTHKHLPKEQDSARYQIVAIKQGKTTLYRAQFVGLQSNAAQALCQKRRKLKQACTLIKPS